MAGKVLRVRAPRSVALTGDIPGTGIWRAFSRCGRTAVLLFSVAAAQHGASHPRMAEAEVGLRFSDTVTLPFDSSHVLEGDERCGRPHGHGYSISVTISAERLDKHGRVPQSDGLDVALRALVLEMDHRDLNTMFPGIQTTPIGLAVMALERLSLRFPRIDEVTVCEGANRCARVTRPTTP